MAFILIAYCFMWYVFVFTASCFFMSGMDDLFIDAYFWLHYWRQPKLSDTFLCAPESTTEQYIAVLIPCWHEADVITAMLTNNIASIDYDHYHLFVGVYPNDPDTLSAVTRVADAYPRVHCVIGSVPGPTTKAANLNAMYAYVKAFEVESGLIFDVFVFHDSEDVIHPLSFKIYNHYLPRYAMVQIPILPLEVGYWEWTHWLYADEFAENHTKNIIVRQAINAHVPSAGVGTGFTRSALQALECPHSGAAFSTTTLTEDYRTSLALRLRGYKLAFISHTVARKRWVTSGFWGRNYTLRVVQEPIATRAFFPRDYWSAVKQKSRWIIGIVFQEWDHTKWPTDWRVRYSLVHDRKGFLTHLINLVSYPVLLFWVIFSQLSWRFVEFPSLQEQLNLHLSAFILLWVVAFIMLERNLQRVIATYRIYGWRPLLGVVPRIFYGNVLNCHALLRAYRIYFSAPKQQKTSRQPVWEKTDHDFPGSHPLVDYRQPFGHVLLALHYVTDTQLRIMQRLSYQTGLRLGEAGCQLGYLTEARCLHALSVQYRLPLVRREACLQVTQLPKSIQRILRRHAIELVCIKKYTLSLAITDPSNALLIRRLIQQLLPYKLVFYLLNPVC